MAVQKIRLSDIKLTSEEVYSYGKDMINDQA
jgi:hypothetical protein